MCIYPILILSACLKSNSGNLQNFWWSKVCILLPIIKKNMFLRFFSSVWLIAKKHWFKTMCCGVLSQRRTGLKCGPSRSVVWNNFALGRFPRIWEESEGLQDIFQIKAKAGGLTWENNWRNLQTPPVAKNFYTTLRLDPHLGRVCSSCTQKWISNKSTLEKLCISRSRLWWCYFQCSCRL